MLRILVDRKFAKKLGETPRFGLINFTLNNCVREYSHLYNSALKSGDYRGKHFDKNYERTYLV